MDTRRTSAVVRVFAGGIILESSGASWVNEFEFTSPGTSLGGYIGATYARYMSGDIRNKSRFELIHGTRCNRILELEDDVVTGAILAFGGTAAPTGYLLCNGAVVSRSTYSTLFAAIGTNYGAGDGSTTFRLPDLRGRAPIGTGQGTGLSNRVIGANVGAETHTLIGEEMPVHAHTNFSKGDPSEEGIGFLDTDPDFYKNNGEVVKNGGAAGSGWAHNNMQPSQVCTFIIKT